MDLNQSIDIYCERRGPEFWAEPINAISNIAFIIAAVLAWRLYNTHVKNKGNKEIHVGVLIALAFSVGIGSFLFHTFATLWGVYADIIPIYVFAFYYIIIASWKIIEMNRNQAILSAVLIALVFILISTFIPRDLFNGSSTYFPFAIILGAYGIILQYKKHFTGKYFLIGAVIFVLALLFRTIDMIVCPYIPFGVHYIWHSLSGLLFYVLLRALILTQAINEEGKKG